MDPEKEEVDWDEIQHRMDFLAKLTSPGKQKVNDFFSKLASPLSKSEKLHPKVAKLLQELAEIARVEKVSEPSESNFPSHFTISLNTRMNPFSTH